MTRTPIVIAALLLSACGSSGATTPKAKATGAGDVINITNYAFSPSPLTVAPGATVTVTNNDQYAHHLASTKAGEFDPGETGGGSSKTFTAPTTPGTYTYLCTIHSSMHGTLVVKG